MSKNLGGRPIQFNDAYHVEHRRRVAERRKRKKERALVEKNGVAVTD